MALMAVKTAEADQLAALGREIALSQGQDLDDLDLNWTAYGAACRSALAKGNAAPRAAQFRAGGDAARVVVAIREADEPAPPARKRTSAYDAPRSAILESLRNELTECRRRLTHYSRLTVELELRLEQVDHEQQRAYRRSQELAEAIETEEDALHRLQSIELADARLRREHLETEVLAALRRRPERGITAPQLAAALNISTNYAMKVLSRMTREGRLRRLQRGVYVGVAHA